MTNTITQYLPPQLSSPVTFLGCTVLSFNGSLGFGSQETTLTVELIEDCNEGQVFAYGSPDTLIGRPAFFPEESGGMAFSFYGIITNWTKNDSSSGLTYSVTMTDPRRILENVAVIVDTYSGSIANAPNVYNVYGSYEPQAAIAAGNCSLFGTSGNINDRGMPYQKVISRLATWPGGLVVYSPTGYPFTVNLSALPSTLPEYYRVNGPAISLLQLITDVCEATGNDFYVYLGSGDTIHIELINLKQNPTSFNWIQNYGVGNSSLKVLDRSFGRELRTEKQKNLILGEKVHYLNMATDFIPFFGENTSCNPVIAEAGDQGSCGFKVLVNTAPLAASLRSPGVFATGGDVYVNEVDLRCNHDLWWHRVMYKESTEGLSQYALLARQWIVQATGQALPDPKSAVKTQELGLLSSAGHRSISDDQNNPNIFMSKVMIERVNEDKKKIFGYIESLANTYYGKQFVAKIYDNICYKPTSEIIGGSVGGGDCITSEIAYSAVPTNDGGWVEPGQSVIGVGDPYLGFFRQEDGRVGPFALFSVDGTTPAPENIGHEEDVNNGGAGV